MLRRVVLALSNIPREVRQDELTDVKLQTRAKSAKISHKFPDSAKYQSISTNRGYDRYIGIRYAKLVGALTEERKRRGADNHVDSTTSLPISEWVRVGLLEIGGRKTPLFLYFCSFSCSADAGFLIPISPSKCIAGTYTDDTVRVGLISGFLYLLGPTPTEGGKTKSARKSGATRICFHNTAPAD